MLETVPEARPVTRVISAWVISPSPCPRSSSTTRRWFAGRSDAVDPGEGRAPRASVMAELCWKAPAAVKS